jgi:hypothetical protein
MPVYRVTPAPSSGDDPAKYEVDGITVHSSGALLFYEDGQLVLAIAKDYWTSVVEVFDEEEVSVKPANASQPLPGP